MATHSSTLAWRIPWTEEPGGLQSLGSQRVRHDWAHTGIVLCVCVCVCVSSNLAVHADARMPILHVWVSLPALQKGASVPFS